MDQEIYDFENGQEDKNIQKSQDVVTIEIENESEIPSRTYWVYHNITTTIASLIFAYALFQTDFFREAISIMGEFGYVSAFLIGMFFVSAFTVAPATASFVVLSENLHIVGIAVFGGLGAMTGDYLIFRFVREGLAEDLGHLFSGIGDKKLFKIFKSKYFGVLTPIIGALIIASPLPDEFGIGLLGLSLIDNKKFIALSLFLNMVGIAGLLGIINLFR